MRKTLAFLLALTLTVSAVACGTPKEEILTDPSAIKITNTPTPTAKPTEAVSAPTETEQTSTPSQEVVATSSSLDMINAAWNLITEQEKEDYYLGVFGGYGENMVEGVPAKFEVDQAYLDATNEELKQSYEAAGILDKFVPETVESITQQYLATTPEMLEKIDDIAAVFDFMDFNRLTFAVHHVKNASDVQSIAEAFKDVYTHMPYCCNQPDRLVVAYKDNYVFIILGIADYAGLVNDKLLAAYPDITVIYDDVPEDLSWWNDGLM